ncbi:E3 ubiquitin-protein ligase Siah2 [Sardina pilchardus]|uniref:E3 ubiquitin-protein ligase Siah2 n=1 Tax=Sardina pilchardus TaxID=27697 RepID=UPI002E129090
MLCPASCFPLLRELPQWPCLLSWSPCQNGAVEAWQRTSAAGVTEVVPPICPGTPSSWRKSTGDGCIQSQLGNTDHQKEVSELQPCTCPYSSSCQWQGILGSVVPHLIQAHQPITDQEGEEVLFLISDINVPDRVDSVMLQSCFEQKFVLVVKKEAVVRGSPTSFFATVLFAGVSDEAEGFVYRLELRGNRRRLMWEAAPRAIQRGGLANAVTDSDCMVFDSAVANLFTDSGKLGIHVSISRSCSIADPTSRAQELLKHRHSTGKADPAPLMQGTIAQTQRPCEAGHFDLSVP